MSNIHERKGQTSVSLSSGTSHALCMMHRPFILHMLTTSVHTGTRDSRTSLALTNEYGFDMVMPNIFSVYIHIFYVFYFWGIHLGCDLMIRRKKK